jgi:hypothetical protein
VRRAGIVLGWVAVVAPFVIEAWAIVRASNSWLVQRLPDDAYYYLEVARHLGRGDGFTFDGINATNGFHPLWQFLLVPFARLFPGDDAFAKSVLVLGVALALVAVVLVVRVVERAAGIGAALFGALVAVHGPGVLGDWVNGMEGPVVLLTLALVLTALECWDERPTPVRAGVLGALSALAVLARFDLAAVVWVVPVAMALRAKSAKWLLRWALGAAIVGVPFGMMWWVRWRHILTTSAMIKNDSLDKQIRDQYGGRFTTDYAAFVISTWRGYVGNLVDRLHPGGTPLALLARLWLACLAVGGAASRLWIRRTAGPRPMSASGWAIVVVVVVVGLKAVVDVIAAPYWASLWYAAPQQLALAFVVGSFAWLGVRALLRYSRPVGAGVLALAVVVVLPLGLPAALDSGEAAKEPGRWQHELASASGWVASHGPPGRYGAYDAGLLGYQLDGQFAVVNLDGLVNSYAYGELLVNDVPERERFQFAEVDYLVNRLSDPRLLGDLACGVPLWRSEFPAYSAGSNFEWASIYVVDVRSCRAS